MKPKISTGYLTPQVKRNKHVTRHRLSDTEEKDSETGIDENVFTALMKCPQKKKMILQLLAANKDAIEKYKKNDLKSSAPSPVGKLKGKKVTCESPTALLRRRALEQMNTNSSSNSSSRSKSRCSGASSDYSTTSIPFEKILDGVVAYVEIKNKEQDRSSGAKAILKSMGAELREKFTNDVTHVIFKDGSFMTYQKAKLMKIHLVSILWVEFCRKTMRRQPERQYPALKSGFQDNETSMICSQMQKEYEDIIRDEYRKSIMEGTPLPSIRTLIDRRRTLMTPSVSNLNSSTSFQTAAETISSQELLDNEVASINELQNSEVIEGESLVLNDPDYFSDTSGPVVNGNSVERRNSISNYLLNSISLEPSDMELTNLKTPKFLIAGKNSFQNQKDKNDSDMELTVILDPNKTPKDKASKSDIYSVKTPTLPAKKVPFVLFDRRKTICNSLLSSDTSAASLISSDKSNMCSLISSDKSTNISDNPSFAVPKSVKKSKRSSSSLFGSNESFQFAKNRAKSSKICSTEIDKTTSAISELNLSSDKNNAEKSSDMSNLHLSSEQRDSRVSKSSTRRSRSVSNLHFSSELRDKTSSEGPTSMSDLGLSSEQSSKNKELSRSSTRSVSNLHLSSELKGNKSSEGRMSISDLRMSSEQSNKNKELSRSLTRSVSNLHLSSELKGNKSSEERMSMSDLRLSSEKSSKSKEPSRSSTRSVSNLHLSSELKGNKSSEGRMSMSDLRLSSEKSTKSKEPSRSSTRSASNLHLSSELKGNKSSEGRMSMSDLRLSSDKSIKDKELSTLESDPSMSSLHVSSDKMPNLSVEQLKEKRSNSGFSSLDGDDSSTVKNLVDNAIRALQTPEFVTVRKKSNQGSALLRISDATTSSDDSEILSHRKNVRKRKNKQIIREDENLHDSGCKSDDNILVKKGKDLELASSATKRRKTLGSVRGTKSVTVVEKDFLNKTLVVNIVKSPINNLQSNKENAETKELKNTRRRTLGQRGLKEPDLSKSSQTDSSDDSAKKLIDNSTKSTSIDNSNRKSRDVKRQTVRKTKDKKKHQNTDSKTTSSDKEMDHLLNNKTSSDESNDSTKSRKKLRKLYNPDDSIHVLVDEEMEREQKRNEVRKRKSDGVFINPSDLLKLVDAPVQKAVTNESTESEGEADEEILIKRTKAGKDTDLKRVSLNSSADEQKELLNEVINRKNIAEVVPKTPKRVTKNKPKDNGRTSKRQTPTKTPSRRKSMRVIKPTQKAIDLKNSEIPITPINRRSTLDFQPLSSNKKPKKVDKSKLPTIVCTKLHKADVQLFAQIVRKLGRFTVEDEVSSRTTHLVAGEPKRTINMLRAVSRGCWVLRLEWVFQSLEAGKWLREEDFEVHDFSPVVQKSRLQRQAFGPTYTLDVFESSPPIYVARSTNPRCSDLRELITMCRGRVVTAPRMAKIIVGEYVDQEDTVCVNETWVLDCITFNKKMSFKSQYLLEKSKRKSLVV